MTLLILDNYDSFTYNLAHLIEKVSDINVEVFRNDAISIEQINRYDKIVLSPGPGLPKEAGIMPELLNAYHQTKSIFGICLGMQAIGEHYGANLINLNTVCHGLALPINTTKDDLFAHCPNTFLVGRYHSWVVNPKQFPNDLQVTATDKEGHIMALKHVTDDVCGVQFHPESVLSEYGERIFSNWLHKK